MRWNTRRASVARNGHVVLSMFRCTGRNYGGFDGGHIEGRLAGRDGKVQEQSAEDTMHGTSMAVPGWCAYRFVTKFYVPVLEDGEPPGSETERVALRFHHHAYRWRSDAVDADGDGNLDRTILHRG